MRYLLKNANVFHIDGVCSSANVLIEGAKIAKVSVQNIEAAAQEYDLSGYTLLPGLINTHVHLMDCFDGFNEDKLKVWLMSGFTHLRDQGILSKHTTKDAVIWREKLKCSNLFPSISVCGKYISSVNGYGGIEPIGVMTERKLERL